MEKEYTMIRNALTSKYALILFCFIFSALYNQQYQATENKRPAKVQQAVDEVFEDIKSETVWGYNGRDWYELLGIDEEILVKHLISLGKKDIYLMDVGCGRGNWAQNIKNIIDTQYQATDTTFHIFSITGGQESQETIYQSDHVIIHQLNQCKIENINEELTKYGLDLTNKMDIIVAHWALRHMVDPLGTIERLYELLSPEGGKLLSNGVLCKLDSSDEIQGLPADHPHIFTLSNATVLFRKYNGSRDTDQFLLERNDDHPLNLPLRYTGSLEHIGDRYQCASKQVTEFQLSDKIIKERTIDKVNSKKGLYCFSDDKKCKELYNRLKKQGLFKSPFKKKS